MLNEVKLLDYTVTWLEMTARPAEGRLPVPGKGISLLRAHEPPTHFFLYLYGTVGGPYEWTDMLDWSAEELETYVGDPDMHLYVAMGRGVPAGFFQLDYRTPGTCDLAYFGIMPEFAGMKLGRWLLMEAIHTGWDGACSRMTVNTCTLDHPRALPLYQRCGFVPVRQEGRKRVASQPV